MFLQDLLSRYLTLLPSQCWREQRKRDINLQSIGFGQMRHNSEQSRHCGFLLLRFLDLTEQALDIHQIKPNRPPTWTSGKASDALDNPHTRKILGHFITTPGKLVNRLPDVLTLHHCMAALWKMTLATVDSGTDVGH